MEFQTNNSYLLSRSTSTESNAFKQEKVKVKVEVFFRGRSIVYKDQGEIILLKFAQELMEFGKVEKLPLLEGKRMIMIIAPKKAAV